MSIGHCCRVISLWALKRRYQDSLTELATAETSGDGTDTATGAATIAWVTSGIDGIFSEISATACGVEVVTCSTTEATDGEATALDWKSGMSRESGSVAKED